MAKPSTAGPLRHALVLLAKIVVSGGLLYLLLSRVDTVRFWAYAKRASLVWLAVALLLYLIQMLVSAWRWGLLLRAQRVHIAWRKLAASYMVAYFFNNFLPSNIGGDVIRIRDTAAQAGSKTLATTVILFDRTIGVTGLVLVAAVGATIGAHGAAAANAPVWPLLLWAVLAIALAVATPVVLLPDAFGRILQPLRVFHAEWVGARIARITDALGRFRESPASLFSCFTGAVVVQGVLVGFYVAIARSMHIPVPASQLAVLVPISFVVQMLPISLNGFGVREATFTFYFRRLGLSLESALIVSFMGAALMMLFSLSGAVAYLARGSRKDRPVETA